jgi:hypothetical protein
MNRYFLPLTFSIASLTIFLNLTPAFAKPLSTGTLAPLPKTAVNLRLAIEQFFKAGRLEESWFAPKEPREPEKFAEFRKQALDSRQLILTLCCAYKTVRLEGSQYIATFVGEASPKEIRRELGLEFKLDSQGRVMTISAK